MNNFLEKLTNNVDIERYKVSRIDDIDLRPATMENRI